MSVRLSTQTILFDEHRNKEILRLDNLHSSKTIFKIKVNNIQLFAIYPGKGFIEPSSSLEIQITLKKLTPFEAKLMVMYAPLSPNSKVESYQSVWNSLDKKQLKEELVQLTIKTGERPMKSTSFKQTESPIYEPMMQNSKSQHSLSSHHQTQNPQRRSKVQKTSTNVFQSIIESQRTFTVTSKMEISQYKNLEKELKIEKEITNKLKDKLSEREKKLRRLEGISQKQVNDSLQPKDQSFNMSNCNICLLMLVCLMFGFLMAKSHF